jgi:nucleotide-binding universal stress UspA family protein
METLNKWLVGLDLTEHDQSIISYTKKLSDILHPEHIEFVFIAQRLPDSIHVHLPDELKYPAYDDLFQQLKQEVHQYFGVADPVSCEVLDGPVQFDLWHETFVKDVDLFIAGSKPKHKGRGLFPKKFIRKSFCSVLFVPMDAPDTIEKIWVPTDFSEPSGQALELALHMSTKSDPPGLVWLHHIYQLPHAYYYEGFPKNEILEVIRKDAETQMASFVLAHNPGNEPIETRFTEIYQSYAADNIKMEAEGAAADLIVMASGGRSRFSKFFLGSETEQLVQQEVQVPLMVLKKKTDHVRLRDLYSVNK